MTGMFTVIEIIPSGLEEWVLEAMDDGQLFIRLLDKIKELETNVRDLESELANEENENE